MIVFFLFILGFLWCKRLFIDFIEDGASAVHSSRRICYINRWIYEIQRDSLHMFAFHMLRSNLAIIAGLPLLQDRYSDRLKLSHRLNISVFVGFRHLCHCDRSRSRFSKELAVRLHDLVSDLIIGPVIIYSLLENTYNSFFSCVRYCSAIVGELEISSVSNIVYYRIKAIDKRILEQDFLKPSPGALVALLSSFADWDFELVDHLINSHLSPKASEWLFTIVSLSVFFGIKIRSLTQMIVCE